MKNNLIIIFFVEFVISTEVDNILEFNQYKKSDKMLYIIYANMESLINKIGGCTNYWEKEKWGYSL